MKKLIHVAVGVIFDCPADEKGNVLIAKRADHQHQGGLWEFPGGKVESDETVQVALQRELEEELGLVSDISDMSALMTIPFHYSDKSVLLDVWLVHNVQHYSETVGKEGQPLAWIDQNVLSDYAFPAANKAILDAISLPKKIAITEDNSNPDTILAQVANTLKTNPATWIQLRAPSLEQFEYTQLGMKLYGLCHEAGSKLIWNCPLGWYQIAFADGLHLSGVNFDKANLDERPIPLSQWFSLACHNLKELESAQDLADYLLVSPVKETSTHLDANALTWAGFKVITQQARIPCYALGGLKLPDIEESASHGGQGIAGISCFLQEPLVDEKLKVKESEYES